MGIARLKAHAAAPVPWRDRRAARWERLLTVCDQVLKALEQARHSKLIGTSREAQVELYVSAGEWRALPPILQRWCDDPAARVVILRGAGEQAFAPGDDIAQFVHWGARKALAHSQHLEAFISAVEAFPKPTIALIHGYAVGTGLEVAAACDLRYAATTARPGIPIARLGHTVDLRNARRLIRLVGLARVKELPFTAELIGPEEAFQIGLVHRVLPPEQLERYTSNMAQKMASHAPLSLMQSKASVQICLDNPELRGIDEPAALAAALYDSEDFRAGVEAFLQKRPLPKFRGR
jgi:enoyl-CoA hydratase